MNCANCGTQNADGARFCAGCGSQLPTAPAYQAPAYEAPAYQAPVQNPYQAPVQNPYEAPNPYGAPPAYDPYAPASKKNNTWLWIVLGVVAVAAIAVVLIFALGGGSNSAEGVAEAFMEACASCDVDAVEDLLYGEMKDDASDYCSPYEVEINDFEVIETEELGRSAREEISYKLDAEVEEAQEICAEVTLEFMGYEETGEIWFTVICIDGDWYVYEMDS